jgi:hypothetical protein
MELEAYSKSLTLEEQALSVLSETELRQKFARLGRLIEQRKRPSSVSQRCASLH